MKDYICEACGKSFRAFPAHRDRSAHIFCSRECSKVPIVPIICQSCGNTFLVPARGIKDPKFCSRDCMNARDRREQVHKMSPQVDCVCIQCGKIYSVRSSVAKVQKYCSQECFGIAHADRWVAEKNPNFKGKIAVTCAYCGKVFETYPSRGGRKKYCCRTHSLLGNLRRLASNPRTDIECSMANALMDAGIRYDEQVLMFDKFLVDFRLQDFPIIIQCDGEYWHDRPQVRGRDKGQDNYLSKSGFIVLRFTDKQIYKDLKGCIRKIKRTISERSTGHRNGNADE